MAIGYYDIWGLYGQSNAVAPLINIIEQRAKETQCIQQTTQRLNKNSINSWNLLAIQAEKNERKEEQNWIIKIAKKASTFQKLSSEEVTSLMN